MHYYSTCTTCTEYKHFYFTPRTCTSKRAEGRGPWDVGRGPLGLLGSWGRGRWAMDDGLPVIFFFYCINHYRSCTVLDLHSLRRQQPSNPSPSPSRTELRTQSARLVSDAAITMERIRRENKKFFKWREQVTLCYKYKSFYVYKYCKCTPITSHTVYGLSWSWSAKKYRCSVLSLKKLIWALLRWERRKKEQVKLTIRPSSFKKDPNGRKLSSQCQ